ncbi:MAG TPA: SDR family oxidoreductase [Cytophagaceae bacterium]|jgi:short-subunit dehydrogenase|nr:SDR family oxidoreductase [Cytophagaceae bacterium]
MNPRVLITGASSGIGLELAKIFAQNNHDLVIVARSEDKLLELAQELERKNNIKVKVIVRDLTEPMASYLLYSQLIHEKINIDILINNAGFGTFGHFVTTDLRKQTDMLQLNIIALTQLCHYFGKEMIKAGKGQILNIASTAAFQPGPLMAVYFASKAYVLSFSEALHNEFSDKGVSVSCLCPGLTETGFQRTAVMEEVGMVKGKKMMSAAEVAETAFKGLIKNKTIIIPGIKNKLLAFSVRFSPRSLVTKVARSIMEK